LTNAVTLIGSARSEVCRELKRRDAQRMPDMYLEALQVAFARSADAATAGDDDLADQLHAGFLTLASRFAASYAGDRSGMQFAVLA
jgi:hypothetical protein